MVDFGGFTVNVGFVGVEGTFEADVDDCCDDFAQELVHFVCFCCLPQFSDSLPGYYT